MPLGIVALGIVLAGCGGSSQPVSSDSLASSAQFQHGQNYGHVVPDSSKPAGVGQMHTNHLLSLFNGARPNATPAGFSPQQLRAAYGLPSSGGSGTIVIVDAYHNPYALADFNAFSAQYGLPQETSTNVTASTNKVLQVVYASGRKPSNNSGWSQEADLDIEWAHAMAPNAKIVLLEASSASSAALYTADDVAATISGAKQVSNSWGGSEYSGETADDTHFNHSGVTYFFSSGDTGGVQDYPAASVNVVAVGGTSLTLNSSGTRASEAAWSGAGCGPSSYESRPSFQNAVSGFVGTKRGITDVSAVADPNTGVAVRWNGGWYVFGGTSVACPVIAGITNLAGTNRGSAAAQNAQFYAKLGTSSFYDPTTGTAGSFSAGAGYDYPTGVGSPNGLTGF